MKTFDLNEAGLAAFYTTLAEDIYVLVEATITTFSWKKQGISDQRERVDEELMALQEEEHHEKYGALRVQAELRK
jgi:hypothetical protein